MKDLIDRYLAAVARELPERERADIVAELRDELLTNIEMREEGLGRPLSAAELEAELIAFGNPRIVAGRYRKVQHLIGPQVFPFWWAAMRAALAVIAVVYLVLIVLGLILNGGRVSGLDVPEPLLVLACAFGAVTGVFALIERFGDPATVARWRPDHLPPAGGKTRSRFDLMTEIGMGVVFLLWWTDVIHFQNVFPLTGMRLDLAPVWERYHWWILGYSIVEISSNAIALLRPDRVQLVRWMAIWRSLLGAGILLAVIQAGRFVIVSGPAGKAQAIFDLWMRVGIGIAIAVFLARAATEGWRLYQEERGAGAGA